MSGHEGLVTMLIHACSKKAGQNSCDDHLRDRRAVFRGFGAMAEAAPATRSGIAAMASCDRADVTVGIPAALLASWQWSAQALLLRGGDVLVSGRWIESSLASDLSLESGSAARRSL